MENLTDKKPQVTVKIWSLHQAALELRRTLTLAKVAERLGLSTGRVDQPAKGR
ncbi:hypothetical protein ACIOKD_01085 [Streptomyces sp. NPDC087844]|uniref:hypothetical protein n=1 Tax=Streptomyces sp. NPDC087844 TaxID=3365805 RepID=UPI0037F854D9